MKPNKLHTYKSTVQWTGNQGEGTSHYAAYSRNHHISIENKITIEGSSDPAFRGDNAKHNPEDFFLSSISACHMLWYLHLCAQAGVIVLDYMDTAEGKMLESENGKGQFIEVQLHPIVTVTKESMVEQAKHLHHEANAFCFIANSLNFPVQHRPIIRVENE